MATRHFRKPEAVIQGLKEGKITLTMFSNDGYLGESNELSFEADGAFTVPRHEKMKFSYDGPKNPSLQCLIVSR